MSLADRIAHYKILRQIGRGGQGTVYLAEDSRLHRQVALKVMDPGFASDAIAVERFKREAEITSKLDHAGICTVNVWEWCRDPWCGYELPADPGDCLRHAAASHGRAARGGSFFNDALAARSAVRGYYTPDVRDHNIGVRPVRR